MYVMSHCTFLIVEETRRRAFFTHFVQGHGIFCLFSFSPLYFSVSSYPFMKNLIFTRLQCIVGIKILVVRVS